MTKLDKLLNICSISGIHVVKTKLPAKIKAIYYSDEHTEPIIALNKTIPTDIECACHIAEELGHHYTSCGNLLTESNLHKSIIRKQENIAKRWGLKYMISLSDIVGAHLAGCRTIHEVAEYLEITEEFLLSAAKMYESIYGSYIVHQDYRVYFDPLWVTAEAEGAEYT